MSKRVRNLRTTSTPFSLGNKKRKFSDGKRPRSARGGKFTKRNKEQSFQLDNDEEITSDEEILSDAEDASEVGDDNVEKKKSDIEDDEFETAEDKRRRLSKMYLEKISQLNRGKDGDSGSEEDEFAQKGDNSDEEFVGNDHNRWVSEKLEQQRLMQKGKYFQDYSKAFSSYNFSELPRHYFTKGHQGAITCLSLSNDEQHIVSGSKDNSVILWNTETRQKTFLQAKWNASCDYSSHSKEILCVAISTDGRMIVSGGTEGKIMVYDQRQKYSLVHTFEGHRGPITGLSFQTDSYALFSCARDRCLKYWDLNEMGYVETLFGHQDDVLSIDCWHKLKPLTASSDRTIRHWKVEQSSHLVFRGHKAPIDVCKILTEDSFISGSQDGTIALWKEHRKTPVSILQNAHGTEGVNARWIAGLAAVKASNLFASGSNDGFVRLWSTNNDRIEALGELAMDGYINALDLSPRILVAGCSREPRLGRWTNMKSCQNKICVVRLPTDVNSN